MKLLLKKISYKLLITSMIMVVLSFFVVTSPSEAKLKIGKGQLYYTGTQEGKPLFEKGLWETILDSLSQIIDYILGIKTLGFRMVVIGWIEVMEITLTALLGMPMDLGKFIVDASNGMDGYSQQIVNIESILFNQVPILKANIFDVYTVEEDEDADEDEDAEADEDEDVKDSNKAGKNIESDANANTDIIQIIRDTVAKWYYIMRLIVIAFMLILLLFIGIKMAISTIASEKALYKQMLIDWVAGIILVFSIHYIMVFVLNTNDNIVEALSHITRDGLMIRNNVEYTFGEDDKIKSDKDIEMSLYEEARTRAYDLKLTDGFTGIIIYGALVFYAWKFALVYFRRMLNIVIIVLLAPAVSASYAINKVISGKAKIFSTWFSELIMNTIIQIVHVIIYVSFVSMALELTRQSISGIILTFVILNFMSKADKILRELFKLAGGSGSLAGDMADRTSFSDVKNGMKTLKNAMIGGAVTKTAMKATYKVATMPIKKAGLAVAGKGTEMLLNNEKYNSYKNNKEREKWKSETKFAKDYLNNNETMKNYDKSVDKYNEKLDEYEKFKKQKEKEKSDVENLIGYYYQQGDEENLNIQLDEKSRIEKEIANKEKEVKEALSEVEKNETKLEAEFLEQRIQEASLADVLKENLGTAFRGLVDGEIDKDSGRHVYKRKKLRQKVEGDTFIEKQQERIKRYFEKKNNKDKKTMSVSEKFRDDMKTQNLFGLSDGEMKELKKIFDFEKKRIIGTFSMISFLPMMGINPLVGMGLLTNGLNAKLDASRRERIGNSRAGTIPNSSFKFKSFGVGALMEFSKPETYIALESQKIDALHHKKVSKQVKSELARIKALNKKVEDIRNNSQTTINEFEQKMESYEDDARSKIQTKSEKEIELEQKMATSKMVNISGQYLMFEEKEEMAKFMASIDEIDSRKGISNEERLKCISDEIDKNKDILIRSAIQTVCLENGITDIINVELNEKDVMDINENIVGVLEKSGVIQRGEIDIENTQITEDSISQVYLGMVQDRDEVNKEITESIVQEAILEFMTKNNETDVKKLQTDDAKEEICDIIKEKVISDTSKKSASVIEKITGVDKLKEETELSEDIMDSLEENIHEVKKTNISEESDSTVSKDVLIQRGVNRETNRLKIELERALYMEESSEDVESKKIEELMILLNELQADNQSVSELEFSMVENNNSKTKKKYKYYQLENGQTEESLEKYMESYYGKNDMTVLENKMNGPVVDINKLINRKKQK